MTQVHHSTQKGMAVYALEWCYQKPYTVVDFVDSTRSSVKPTIRPHKIGDLVDSNLITFDHPQDNTRGAPPRKPCISRKNKIGDFVDTNLNSRC